ncbi:hypothetical protein C5167_041146 [Papaver somniferum]|uniref:Uncharacterized protein n=1 Tax=Papaver somniferum TaxID=3469 RepID=A0A4Y7IJD1_PAPSO|nr:hypothetical protein C5167_041146 [Papaver somniferum]
MKRHFESPHTLSSLQKVFRLLVQIKDTEARERRRTRSCSCMRILTDSCSYTADTRRGFIS